MLPQPLTDREIRAALTFVRRLLHESGTSMGAHAKHPAVNVIGSTIAESSEKSDESLTSMMGLYSGHRQSSVTDFSRKTWRDSGMAWTSSFAAPMTTSPTIFYRARRSLRAPLSYRDRRYRRHWTLEPRQSWSPFDPIPPTWRSARDWARGLALMGDTLFTVTLDAHLLAVDATTGAPAVGPRGGQGFRQLQPDIGAACDRRQIVTGVAGGDFGAPGFLAAYSASDGHRLWQFNTIPGPGEPGHETWAGDSWKTGGAGTWVTGAYDKDLDLLYWGVGNAAPVYHSEVRAGDNLYSMSAIAVELSTGKLRWHFQFTPGDDHDWDAANQPVIADIDWQGVRTPVLLWANRNGFFYALDRRTGKFLFAKPFVKQTWTPGIDPSGRPIANSAVKATEKGTLTWPWAGGATNWQPPSYDAARSLVFIPAIDAAGLFFSSGSPRADHRRSSKEELRCGTTISRSRSRSRRSRLPPANRVGKRCSGADSTYPATSEASSPPTPAWSSSDFGSQFLALDSDTGKELWRVNLGGTIKAGPMAFAVEGQEYIAIMGGRALFVFSLSPSSTIPR